MKNSRQWTVSFATALAAGLAFPWLGGAAVQFTLDPNRSVVTLSGSALGSAFKEQGPGSLTTKMQGTLTVVLTEDSIQFPGGSSISAQNNGSWQPLLDGSDGSESANYGGAVSTLLGTAKAALRNIQFDVASGTLLLNNTSFDSSGLTFFFPSNAISTLSYRVSGFIPASGKENLAGYATNQISQGATLVQAQGGSTLTIPLNTTYKFVLIATDDTVVVLTGQLVATRVVAAPVTISSIAVQNQLVTLHWQAAPRQTFKVLSSADLKQWSDAATGVTSDLSDYLWTAPASQQAQFYRLSY